MKTFDDFKTDCGIKEKRKENLKLKLYKDLIELMEKIIKTIFTDKNITQNIISYETGFQIQLNNGTRNTFFISISYSDSIMNSFYLTSIGVSDISCKSLFRLPVYKNGRKSVLLATSNDSCINKFFNEYFEDFEDKVLNNSQNTIFEAIENSINKRIYEQQKSFMESSNVKLNWSYEDFIKSEYAFKVNDDIIENCDNLITEYLFSTKDIRDEISKLE